MKEQALYHLMQLRARKFNESLSADDKVATEEIQSSLKIQRKSGTYVLNWRIHQEEHSITMQSDPFKFYEKGDNTKRNAKRTEKLNYRSRNWDAAMELWQDIFRISNLESGKVTDDGKLAFGNFSNEKSNMPFIHSLGIALLFSLISTAAYSLVDAASLFMAILILLLYTDGFANVHLRKELNIVEKLIIASGCLAPLYYGVNLTGSIFVLSGLYLLNVAERQDSYKHLLISISGAMFGLAMYSMNNFALILAAILLALLILISIIDSQRISVAVIGFFILGLLIARIAIVTSIELGYLTEKIPQELILNQQYLDWIVTGCLLILFINFSTWWIVGVQFYLLPWLSLLALFVATFFLLYMNRNDILVMLGVFLGFNLFIFERLLMGFFTNPSRLRDTKKNNG